MKTRYVVGFFFDIRGRVALITKNRPEWQRGKLNGIGGHIEDGETPLEAMRREFCEEAGLDSPDWEQYCTMNYPEAEVNCFRCFGYGRSIQTMTDEIITWHEPIPLPESVIPNLHWLIPLALYDDDYLETTTNFPRRSPAEEGKE